MSRSSSRRSSGARTVIPAASIACRSLRQRSCWSAVSASTSPLIASSACSGVSPSSEVVCTPAIICSIRPETRTMKNSSRLFAEIDRKRNRSSSGWRALPASSSTRRLNCSQDSSRLMKRLGCCASSSGLSGQVSLEIMEPMGERRRGEKMSTRRLCHPHDSESKKTQDTAGSSSSSPGASPRHSATSARVIGRLRARES